MPADDEALVHVWYEAFAKVDVERIRGFTAPDVELHNPEYAIESGIHRGVDEFVQAVERLHDVFEFSQVDVRRFVRIGDRVAVEFGTAGHARSSGVPVDSVFGHVWTERPDGKVLRLEWYRTYEEAMAAARSEERDVAMIQRRYQAWQAGDLEGALAHVGPAMEWIEPPDTPDGQTWRGREGVLAAMAEWTEPFDEFRFEVIDASSVGGGVLMGLVQRGRVGHHCPPGHAQGSHCGVDAGQAREAVLVHWLVGAGGQLQQGRVVAGRQGADEADAAVLDQRVVAGGVLPGVVKPG